MCNPTDGSLCLCAFFYILNQTEVELGWKRSRKEKQRRSLKIIARKCEPNNRMRPNLWKILGEVCSCCPPVHYKCFIVSVCNLFFLLFQVKSKDRERGAKDWRRSQKESASLWAARQSEGWRNYGCSTDSVHSVHHNTISVLHISIHYLYT